EPMKKASHTKEMTKTAIALSHEGSPLGARVRSSNRDPDQRSRRGHRTRRRAQISAAANHSGAKSEPRSSWWLPRTVSKARKDTAHAKARTDSGKRRFLAISAPDWSRTKR